MTAAETIAVAAFEHEYGFDPFGDDGTAADEVTAEKLAFHILAALSDAGFTVHSEAKP